MSCPACRRRARAGRPSGTNLAAVSVDARSCGERPLVLAIRVKTQETTNMTHPDQERWLRVKGRLRAEVGEDIFSSWFARMELEGLDDRDGPPVGADALPQELDPVALCRARAGVLARRAAESAPHRSRRALGRDPPAAAPVKTPDIVGAGAQRPRDQARRHRAALPASAPILAAHEALGGSPLDPRLTFESLRGRPLQHARPRRRQAGGGGRAAAIR